MGGNIQKALNCMPGTWPSQYLRVIITLIIRCLSADPVSFPFNSVSARCSLTREKGKDCSELRPHDHRQGWEKEAQLMSLRSGGSIDVRDPDTLAPTAGELCGLISGMFAAGKMSPLLPES